MNSNVVLPNSNTRLLLQEMATSNRTNDLLTDPTTSVIRHGTRIHSQSTIDGAHGNFMHNAAFVSLQNSEHNMREIFRKFARDTAYVVGSSWAFFLALVVVIVWAAMGPLFNYSDTWQLVINTGTTIVTFLMVFLIQATQNRDAQAMHLKLDELLRAVTKARTGLVGLEYMTEEEIQELENEFAALQAKYAQRAEERSRKRKTVNGVSTET